MADERDPKLSQHYRGLEPLEPPRELDQKILAAAREAAESPHAPLVAPAGRHRWYYSLAAAAVLVFAVALTLHLEREKPDLEAIATAPGPTVQQGRIRTEEAKQPAKERPAKPVAPPFAPDPGTANSGGLRLAERLEEPAAAAAASRSRPPVAADEMRERVSAEASAQAARREDAARAGQQAKAALAAPAAAPAVSPENPDRWLERIAELRSRGRHAEADRELANFRKAYPDYRLSEAMRERVEGTVAPR